MRINKFVALATGLSRRAADTAIASGRVEVNGSQPAVGDSIQDSDTVTIDKRSLTLPTQTITIMLYKPVGYVCSRNGQGSKTIYDLLPVKYHALKPVGRLDKDTSGLLLLTNDGVLANHLTHPRYEKEKVYTVVLDKTLSASDKTRLRHGVMLEDGVSRLQVEPRQSSHESRASASTSRPATYSVRLSQGRNRQIRRTFDALGYTVTKLHRTQFGEYRLGKLEAGSLIII